MITLKCRYTEIYSCTIEDKDFKKIKSKGFNQKAVYKWLDKMEYLQGGITSNDFLIDTGSGVKIHSFDELTENFEVKERSPLVLTENEDYQKLIILEHSKIRYTNHSIDVVDQSKLAFESQQVILGGDWETTLVHVMIDGESLDLSDEILMESFSGLLISKNQGMHEIDISN